jgi:hypothetical protein
LTPRLSHPFGIAVSIENRLIVAISLKTLPNYGRGDKEMFYATDALLGSCRACLDFGFLVLPPRYNFAAGHASRAVRVS